MVQIGHEQRDRPKDYWFTLEQLFVAFYEKAMKLDRLFHVMRFMHFSDDRNEPDKIDENYGRM
jgi:hypothetical protein